MNHGQVVTALVKLVGMLDLIDSQIILPDYYNLTQLLVRPNGPAQEMA